MVAVMAGWCGGGGRVVVVGWGGGGAGLCAGALPGGTACWHSAQGARGGRRRLSSSGACRRQRPTLPLPRHAALTLALALALALRRWPPPPWWW
jgi:hypothetical protein